MFFESFCLSLFVRKLVSGFFVSTPASSVWWWNFFFAVFFAHYFHVLSSPFCSFLSEDVNKLLVFVSGAVLVLYFRP